VSSNLTFPPFIILALGDLPQEGEETSVDAGSPWLIMSHYTCYPEFFILTVGGYSLLVA
jgi:hypothetical protein